MNIHLDPSSELQLYKQLANQLIELIAKGKLKMVTHYHQFVQWLPI